MTAPMFAHQGGWDEILMVVAPLALIGLVLWIANRRLVDRLAEADAAEPGQNRPPVSDRDSDINEAVTGASATKAGTSIRTDVGEPE